jgi:hypothetical protein
VKLIFCFSTNGYEHFFDYLTNRMTGSLEMKRSGRTSLLFSSITFPFLYQLSLCLACVCLPYHLSPLTSHLFHLPYILYFRPPFSPHHPPSSFLLSPSSLLPPSSSPPRESEDICPLPVRTLNVHLLYIYCTFIEHLLYIYCTFIIVH